MITPPCYPARPVNGGPLERALPKSGKYSMEAKYNGWRAWVHNKTGAMFNRENQPLSINGEFKAALATLRDLPWDWSDVEALERRHNIGRGSLILLDHLSANPGDTYADRKKFLGLTCALAGIETHKELNVPIQPNRVYLAMSWEWDDSAERSKDMAVALGLSENTPAHLVFWKILQECNKALTPNSHLPSAKSVQFFEGIVAKRNDSIYPRQLRSPDYEFPFWMKHRWAY
jgi:hypothetical protein